MKKIIKGFILAIMLGSLAGCGIKEAVDATMAQSEIGNTTEVESTTWHYQFAPAQIGSFKGCVLEEAGPVDMEEGDVFGFDDRLTDGCSAWCGCFEYTCVACANEGWKWCQSEF